MPNGDWTQRESMRIDLYQKVPRLIAIHGYSPELGEDATELVLRQAELPTAIAYSPRRLGLARVPHQGHLSHLHVGMLTNGVPDTILLRSTANNTLTQTDTASRTRRTLTFQSNSSSLAQLKSVRVNAAFGSRCSLGRLHATGCGK